MLFCRTVNDAEKILTILNGTCKRFGLTISFKKTKTQIFNDEDLAKRDTLINIGSEKIDNVQSFTYLGQVITNDPNDCFTIHRRVYELKSVLCDTNVNITTRRKILESGVRSRLTYGTAAWLPNGQELKKLKSCWNQCLRDMVKGGWKRRHVPENEDDDEEANYAFIYTNEQIQNILKRTPLRNFMYSQYLKYIGHICRAENTALTKILLFVKPDRKYYRDPWGKISGLLGVSSDQAKWATHRLMTMSPLYHCGKPCSRGTHNETVKYLALFCSIINGITKESRLRISIPWECFQFFNRIDNSITFTP